MSCMKDGYGPCEYKVIGSYFNEDNTIKCRKLNCRVNCESCGHGKCESYMEEIDDYDWKDHWC